METKEFSFDPLPAGLMMPKPVNSITDEQAQQLEKTGRLAKTRKRDGYRIWAVRGQSGIIKLYTRGLTQVTDYFPHIVLELHAIGMPLQSFLDGEMLLERDGRDDFTALSRIFKAPSAADALVLQQEIGHARYMLFDVVFWGGQKYISRPWKLRYAKIKDALSQRGLRYVIAIEQVWGSFAEAQERVKEQGWEGLVLYDMEGCSDFRLDGKVSRPHVCWKRKPVKEDDFIVRQWIPRPNNHSMVREFVLSQIDPETGKEINCGKCGTGLKNKERAELANDELYPLVIEVRFFERFVSGKLRFPVFVRVRDDKKPEECIFQPT